MNLIAILMQDVDTAREARAECAVMARDGLLTLEDAVVAYQEFGDVKLDQAINLTAAGAMGGAWCGVLVGGLLGVFTGGVGFALAGLAGGAAGGALTGLVSDVGVSDDMMRETTRAVASGQAILFLLGRSGAPDDVIQRLAPFGGTIISSSLSPDAQERINALLAGDTA